MKEDAGTQPTQVYLEDRTLTPAESQILCELSHRQTLGKGNGSNGSAALLILSNYSEQDSVTHPLLTDLLRVLISQ